ncbi:hypothetical protein Holit_00373 [Hollandina sp. SP2]
MSESIEDADHDQKQRVSNHDEFITQLVDEPPHKGTKNRAEDRADPQKQGNDGSRRPIITDQYEGGKGNENLLAGAVENFQHVVLGELPGEVEAPPLYLDLRFLHGKDGKQGRQHQGQGNRKDYPKGKDIEAGKAHPADNGKKPGNYHKTGDIPDMSQGPGDSQHSASLSFRREIQGDSGPHRHNHMLPDAEDHHEDNHREQCFPCRLPVGHGANKQPDKPGHRKTYADFENFGFGKAVHPGEDQYHEEPRSFSKKFNNATLKGADPEDVCQVIILNAPIETVADAEKGQGA